MTRIAVGIIALLASTAVIFAQGATEFYTNPVTPLCVDSSKRSVPCSNTGFGPQVLGSYCMAKASGVMAAGLGSGAPVFSFRYGGANLALVRKVKLSVGDTATAFTAGVFTFDLFAARSFTASDTGGTGATLTGNNGKLRTSFATTGVSDFRVASTATLTAGTRTLDATQLGSISTSDTATAGQPILMPSDFLLERNVGEQPLTLAQNEGFVIQATVPATGTWTFSVQVCWDEVSGF